MLGRQHRRNRRSGAVSGGAAAPLFFSYRPLGSCRVCSWLARSEPSITRLYVSLVTMGERPASGTRARALRVRACRCEREASLLFCPMDFSSFLFFGPPAWRMPRLRSGDFGGVVPYRVGY